MDKYFTLAKRKHPGEKTSHKKKKHVAPKAQYIACPICSSQFAASRIESHAAQCQPRESVKTEVSTPAPRPPMPTKSRGKENGKSALEHLMQVAKVKPKPITFEAKVIDGNFSVTWTHGEVPVESAWQAKHLLKPLDKSAFEKGFVIKLCSHEAGASCSDYEMTFPFSSSGLTVPVLKSCLQKAVRRQDGEVALRSAAELMKVSFRDFIRRITVIVLEDVMLRDTYPGLVWLLMADHKGFMPRKEHISFCLNTVLDLCRCSSKDHIAFEKEVTAMGLNRLEGLDGSKRKGLVGSMIIRSRYGGMGCDIRLLQASSGTWHERLSNRPDKWIPLIERKPNENIPPRGFSCTPPQQPLLAAIDFHVCGWMPAKIYHTLRSNPSLHSRLDNLGLATEEQATGRIQSCIWHFRSSVNPRKGLIDTSPEPHLDPTLQELWQLIRKQVDSISQSVINKQRRNADQRPRLF